MKDKTKNDVEHILRKSDSRIDAAPKEPTEVEELMVEIHQELENRHRLNVKMMLINLILERETTSLAIEDMRDTLAAYDSRLGELARTPLDDIKVDEAVISVEVINDATDEPIFAYTSAPEES